MSQPSSSSSTTTTTNNNTKYHCQYIYDRVTGNSYVPRDERYFTNWGNQDRRVETSLHNGDTSNHGSSRNRSGPQSNKKKKSSSRLSSHNENDNNDEETNDEERNAQVDPNCPDRPPHYLCRVPLCVACCPRILEQNALCRRLGAIGCHTWVNRRPRRRRRLFFVGLVFNFLALVFTIGSSMAFSRNHDILTTTSFARTEALSPQYQNGTAAFVTLNIGFRAVAVDDPFNVSGQGAGDHVVLFDTFCGSDYQGFVKDQLGSSICGDCVESSQSFIMSCLFSIILIVRNMLSDVNRMYPKYDLNCPNLTGSLMATLSVFLGLFIIATYQQRCFNDIETQLENADGGGISSEVQFEWNNETITVEQVNFDWWRGPGLVFLILATFLRFVDALCNFIVPTPSITRDVQEQQAYEQTYGHVERTMRGGRRAVQSSRHQQHDDNDLEENADEDTTHGATNTTNKQ